MATRSMPIESCFPKAKASLSLFPRRPVPDTRMGVDNDPLALRITRRNRQFHQGIRGAGSLHKGFDAVNEFISSANIDAGITVAERGFEGQSRALIRAENASRYGIVCVRSEGSLFRGRVSRPQSPQRKYVDVPTLVTPPDPQSPHPRSNCGSAGADFILRDGRYGAALVIFLLAGITDGLDGWIAKRFDSVTDWAPFLIRSRTRCLLSVPM